MKSQKIVLIALFLLPFFALGLFCDIAPARVEGISLTTVKNSQIKMKSEVVNIYYSEKKCEVNAKFFMENLTGRKITMNVGFPVDMSILYKGGKINKLYTPYNFLVKVNNKKINTVTGKTTKQNRENPYKRKFKNGWVEWENDFNPGVTKIEVTYKIFPSRSSRKQYLNIYYIFSTGALWKDKIDEALLNIHFEQGIKKKQIMSKTSPTNYKISNNTVSWKFTDFEPMEKDNLRFEFMKHSDFKMMNDLTKKIKNNSNSNQEKIQLAQMILSSSSRKERPYKIKADYFEKELLDKITNKEEKIFILSVYLKDNKKKIEGARNRLEKFKNDKRMAIIYSDLLSKYISEQNKYYYFDPDFQAKKSKIRIYIINKLYTILDKYQYRFGSVNYSELEEAEALLLDVIKSDPSNYLAWNTYLSNYHKFYYSGREFKSRAKFFSERQKNLIKKALLHCWTNEGIMYWNEIIKGRWDFVPKKIGKLAYRNSKPRFLVDTPFGGWIDTGISDSEINYLLKFYKFEYDKDHGPNLVLKEGNVSQNDKDKLLEILNSTPFYSFHFQKKLIEYNRNVGIFPKRKSNRLRKQV